MSIKSQIVTGVKRVSTILITSVVSLEFLNIVLGYNTLLHVLMPLLWFGRVAVAIHLVEGIIAAAIAQSQHKSPFRYAVYTFFVGTVGLFELMDDDRIPTFLKKLQS